MAPWMQALMGMQGMAPDGEEQVTETIGNPITAVGNRNERPDLEEDMGDDQPYFGNRRYLEAVDNARTENEDYRKENPRKGMFGTKGTLRDILGVVGDAFLVQSGNKPVYMPQREQERTSDAMAGYTQDELGAIERLAAENPAFAAELKKMYNTDRYRKVQQESLQQNRQATQANQRARRVDQYRQASANILNNPNAYGPDGNLTDEAYQLIVQQGRAAEASPEDIGVEAGMSRNRGSLVASSNINVYQQETLPIARQRADAATSQAESSAIRANNPPAPRAPRGETDSEREIRLGDKDPEDLTPGEKSWLEGRPSRNRGSTGRGGRPPIPGAPVPATTRRTPNFRPATRN